MLSIGKRKPASLIVLLLAVYTATFLLHDLAWGPLPLPADNSCSPLFDAPAPDGGDSRHHTTRPDDSRHQCPFCSGFTGSIIVTPLPPPAESDTRAAALAVHADNGAPAFSTFARAPPAA